MANDDNKNGNGGMKWPPKVGQGVKLWASGKEPRDERQAQAIQPEFKAQVALAALQVVYAHGSSLHKNLPAPQKRP